MLSVPKISVRIVLLQVIFLYIYIHIFFVIGIKFSTRQVIGRHRITVTTCVTVGSLYMMGFPKDHFTHIIIDEAGQATEPEIMIPLGMFNVDFSINTPLYLKHIPCI